jgi:hypothetical protein
MSGNPYLSHQAISGSAGGAAAGGSAGGAWGAAIGGVLGGLSGASSAKGSDAAGDAMGSQQALSQQDLDFRKQVYGNEANLTYPQREKLKQLALSDQPLYYDKNAAMINKQYNQADRQTNYLNYGSNLNFGQDTSRLQANALQRRQALAGAYQTGLTNRTNLLTASAGMGAPLQAAGQVGQGHQNMANMYGGWANQYNQAQAQQAQNYGQMAGGLAQYAAYNRRVNTPTGGYPPPPNRAEGSYTPLGSGGYE